MKMRIVVADESEANFLAMNGCRAPLQLLSRLENESARLYERDLETDRPGRSFDRIGAGRHAIDGERSTQRQQQVRFAKRIAEALERARKDRAFDRLVVMAAPRMLGLLRDAMPDTSRAAVVAEVPKDLVHVDPKAIRNYIPRAALIG